MAISQGHKKPTPISKSTTDYGSDVDIAMRAQYRGESVGVILSPKYFFIYCVCETLAVTFTLQFSAISSRAPTSSIARSDKIPGQYSCTGCRQDGQ